MGLRTVQPQPCPRCCSRLHVGKLGISTPLPWAWSQCMDLLVIPHP